MYFPRLSKLVINEFAYGGRIEAEWVDEEEIGLYDICLMPSFEKHNNDAGALVHLQDLRQRGVRKVTMAGIRKYCRSLIERGVSGLRVTIEDQSGFTSFVSGEVEHVENDGYTVDFKEVGSL